MGEQGCYALSHVDFSRRQTDTAQTKVYTCPVEVTLDLIGGKWKPVVLWHLKEHGVLRHGALRRLIPGVSQKVLTQQLRQLPSTPLRAGAGQEGRLR